MKSTDAPRLSARGLRIAALLVILCLTCLWALGETRRRGARRHWDHPLLVDVVFLYRGSPPPGLDHLRRGVPDLERWLTAELRRYRPQSRISNAALLTVHRAVPVTALPPAPPEDGGPLQRVQAYLSLRRYLLDVDRLALGDRRGELQLYVVVEPPTTRVRFAEGWNAGERSVIQTAVDAGTVDLALIAMGHELLHAVGASDKYDDAGHAIEPGGLAEPERVPRYPQPFAEIMVGERPTAPGQGADVLSLSEVQVGLATARELRWVR